MRITVLGARGSIPASGTEKSEFGQATSCYMVEAGKELIFLDAGSGITDLPDACKAEGKEVSVFLSHVHLDHIQGLPFFPLLTGKDQKINIYLPTRLENAQKGVGLAETLGRFFLRRSGLVH